MLRVAAGHYRDSFMRVVYDVYRVKPGVWTFRIIRDGEFIMVGDNCECESKAAAARLAHTIIADAL